MPCDGEIVNLGEIEQDFISQIKGATYSVSSFLGVDPLRVYINLNYSCLNFLQQMRKSYSKFSLNLIFDLKLFYVKLDIR